MCGTTARPTSKSRKPRKSRSIKCANSISSFTAHRMAKSWWSVNSSRRRGGLSHGVSSGFGPPTKDDSAPFPANAISNPQNGPKVEASFKDELARTVKDGFTADEVAAAKKSWLDARTVGRSQDQSLM